jgi:nitrogenase subunit NifH
VTPIPKHADFVKAELYRMSIFDLAPSGEVARCYTELAQRVIDLGSIEVIGQRSERVATWQ